MRYLQILVVIILFCGCSDNIEDSNQTMQGLYNDILFRSSTSSAHIDENGYLIIEGSSVVSVRLQVEIAQEGEYEILDGNNNEAMFDLDSEMYITEGEGTGGKIVIEKITDNSVSGNFYFDARLNGVGERLNFQKGVFYKIPFKDPDSGGNGDGDNDDDPIDDNFQALVDGADFTADITQTSISNNILNISGIQSDVTISITLPADLQAGDYDITLDGDQMATYTQNDNTESAVEGQLTIDVLDEDQISGSFSFTTENGIEITQGELELGL